MQKCVDCGRKFGILYKKHKTDDGKNLCVYCYEKYLINSKRKIVVDDIDKKLIITKEEEITERDIDIVKDDVNKEDENHPSIIDLNESQRKAVLSGEKRLLILAGAGSGKTKTLIQKILYLLSEKSIDPRNILAITFTKNATNEMIDRLIFSADKNGEYKDIIYSKKLSKRDKELKRREYIKKYPWVSNLSVKTFHGLCNQILRTRGGNVFDNKFNILVDKAFDADLNARQQAKENQEEIINKIILRLSEKSDYLLSLK